MEARRSAFQHDAALLNPRFESYKIIADDGDGNGGDGRQLSVRQYSYALPGGVMGVMGSSSSGKAESEAMLGYKEVQDRSRATLLVAGTRASQAAYIDDNGFVILITLNDGDGRPAYAPLHRIEHDDCGGSAEMYGLVALQDERWLVSNGAGALTMLVTSRQSNGRWSGRIAGRWRWSDEKSQQPFRIIAAKSNGTHVNVLLQRTCKSEVAVASQPGLGGARTTAYTRQTARTTFELAVAKLGNVEEEREEMDSTELQISARYTLEDSPLHAFFSGDDDVVIIAEKSVVALGGHASSNVKEPMLTASDASTSGASVADASKQGRTAPYAWTQTSETVTMVLQLPNHALKNDIRCHFTPTHLDLELVIRARISEVGKGEVDAAAQDALMSLQQGRYANRKLHAEIDAGNSVWTWEANAAGGVLTLHLEKKHAGQRWVSVFAASGEDGDDDDDEVPETLDAGAMLDMLDGVAKYTTDTMDGDVGARGGVGAGLLEDGLEEEDGNIGHACVASHLRDGTVDVIPSGAGGLTLLAVPLPSGGNNAQGIVLRRDLDGLYFRIKAGCEALTTKHADTLPALGYVLASKRDANRVFVHSGAGEATAGPTAVLAFEPALSSGTESTAAGNLFVYYSSLERQQGSGVPRIASHARSRVVRLGSDGEDGAVVGATAIQAADTSPLLLVLCQRRLLVLYNVL